MVTLSHKTRKNNWIGYSNLKSRKKIEEARIMSDDWYYSAPPEPPIVYTPDEFIEETIEAHLDELNYEKTSISALMDIEDLEFKELIKHDPRCKKQQLI